MNTGKQSKKALRNQLSESFKSALKGLDLPEPSKKIHKAIDRQSKTIAALYLEILKKAEKKKKKAEKMMKKALLQDNGRKRKRITTSTKPDVVKA